MADYYWVGGSGNWSDYANHWATTSGGSTKHVIAPTSSDNVIFDASSSTAAFTVTLNTTGNHANFDSIDVGQVMTFSGSGQTLNAYGDVTLASDMVVNDFGMWRFQGATAKMFSANNAVVGAKIEQYTVGGEFILGGNLTTTNTFYLTAGTLTLNVFNLTCLSFYSSGSAVRHINFGINSITCTGSGNQWYMPDLTNYTQSGVPTVRTTYVGTDTQTVNHGGTSSGGGGDGGFAVAIILAVSYGWINWQTGLFLLIAFQSGNANFNGPKTIFNDFGFPSGSTTSTDPITFGGGSTCPQEITFNGVGMTGDIIIDAPGCGVKLVDNMQQSTTRTVKLRAGTLFMNGRQVEIGAFESNSTAVRGIDFESYTPGGYINIRTNSIYGFPMLVYNAESITITGESDIRWTGGDNPTTDERLQWDGTDVPVGSCVNLTVAGTGAVTIAGRYKNVTIASTFNGGRSSWGGLQLYGDLTINSTFLTHFDTYYGSEAYASQLFIGDGDHNVTLNGEYIDCPLAINKSAGVVRLLDDFRLRDDDGWYGLLRLDKGVLDLNGHTFYCASVYSATTDSRTIDLSNSASRLQVSTNQWTVTDGTNFTVLDTAGQYIYFDTFNRPLGAAVTAQGTITNGPDGFTASNAPKMIVNNLSADLKLLGAFNKIEVATGFSKNIFVDHITWYGDARLPVTGTRSSYLSGSNTQTFAGSGAQHLDFNGLMPSSRAVFTGSGPYIFESAVNFGSTAHGFWGDVDGIDHQAGTIDFNGQVVEAQSYTCLGDQARELDFTNGGTLKLTSFGNTYLGAPATMYIDGSNFTITDPNHVGRAYLTNSGATSIAGVGPFPTIKLPPLANARTLTINDPATLWGFEFEGPVGAAAWTVAFPIGTTNFVVADIDGLGAGKALFQSLSSSYTSTWSMSSGFAHLRHLSIRDIAATGGAIWNAPVSQGNLNRGHTSGINFGAANFTAMLLRRLKG